MITERSPAYREGWAAYFSGRWPLQTPPEDNPYAALNRRHGGGYEREERDWDKGYYAAEDFAHSEERIDP